MIKTAYIANSEGLLGLCCRYSVPLSYWYFLTFCGDKEENINKTKHKHFSNTVTEKENDWKQNKPETVNCSQCEITWNINDAENGQIGKFIDYETPETDTFSVDSQEHSLEVRGYNANDEKLKYYPTSCDNEWHGIQTQELHNLSHKTNHISKFYSRNAHTPCSIHNVMC